MFPKEIQPLLSERNFCDYVSTTLPNLLDIDLWPRDPTRTNIESRAWGEQSDGLVKCFHDVRAKVRLRLRCCQRFRVCEARGMYLEGCSRTRVKEKRRDLEQLYAFLAVDDWTTRVWECTFSKQGGSPC